MREDEDYIDERTSLGNAPAYGDDEADRDELRERCRSGRDAMKPRETADCAGSALEEQYENEEDGGS
ncbi:MAG: hypothetical protein IBX62_00130 [Coriobacteriia bacterium]|nr:hypothetical protein [Coriobacteriia bacterium]